MEVDALDAYNERHTGTCETRFRNALFVITTSTSGRVPPIRYSASLRRNGTPQFVLVPFLVFRPSPAHELLVYAAVPLIEAAGVACLQIL